MKRHPFTLCLLAALLVTPGRAQFTLLVNEDRPSPIDNLLQVVWEPSSLIRWWTGLDQLYNIALGWRTAAKQVAALPFRGGRALNPHVTIQKPRSSLKRRSKQRHTDNHLERFNQVYSELPSEPQPLVQQPVPYPLHFYNGKNNLFPATFEGMLPQVNNIEEVSPDIDNIGGMLSPIANVKGVPPHFTNVHGLASHGTKVQGKLPPVPKFGGPLPPIPIFGGIQSSIPNFEGIPSPIPNFEEIPPQFLELLTPSFAGAGHLDSNNPLSSKQSVVKYPHLLYDSVQNFDNQKNQNLDFLNNKLNDGNDVPTSNQKSPMSIPVPFPFIGGTNVPNSNPEARLKMTLKLLKDLGNIHMNKVVFDDDPKEESR